MKYENYKKLKIKINGIEHAIYEPIIGHESIVEAHLWAVMRQVSALRFELDAVADSEWNEDEE